MSNYCIKVEGGNYDYLEFEDRFAVLKIAGQFSQLRKNKDEIRK